MKEAELIVNRLTRTARRLTALGYGTTQLVFSDYSFVSLSCYEPSAYEEIGSLLMRGEWPLGFLAPLRNCFALPLVSPWTPGDEQAEATLRSLAQQLFAHRVPENRL